jgi:hypothetical protein
MAGLSVARSLAQLENDIKESKGIGTHGACKSSTSWLVDQNGKLAQPAGTYPSDNPVYDNFAFRVSETGHIIKFVRTTIWKLEFIYPSPENATNLEDAYDKNWKLLKSK